MRKARRAFWAFSALASAALLAVAGVSAQADAPSGVILSLNGPVTPANARYLEREINAASDAGRELIVIEVDTPGGLVDSMKTIIKAVLGSSTPVATYVSPQGARSASAGLYIMYAAHVSAMAPATNTGSATPIEVGGGSPSERDSPFEAPDVGPETDAPEAAEPEADPEGGEAAEGDDQPAAADRDEAAPALGNEDALRAKVINDSAAYIRALAEERGRNADWAEKAVREAANVTSREALELGVIDLVADDLADLLAQIDGRTVTTAAGPKAIDTERLTQERVEASFVERLLGFIANPNVAVILMTLATTGLIAELWNPGSIYPGAFGAICLVLGLYSFQVLPFNWLGVALMLLGALLILLEAYTPTFGLSGLVGLAMFAGGLFGIFPEGYDVSPAVITALVATAGGFLALVLFAVVGSRSRGPMIGSEAIRKREGVVDDWDGREGWVIVEGERWRARSDKPLQRGDKIRVVEVDGLVLVVKQAKAGKFLGGGPAPAEA
ncbi:MAG: NfeD family protein [Parvularculaceae bacterium]